MLFLFKINIMAKFAFLLLSIMSFWLKVDADTGCSYNGYVYTRAPYFNNIFDANLYWSVPIQDNCPLGALHSTQYANVSATSTTTCYVGFFVGGMQVNYAIDFCPLDDFIWVLTLISGIFGYVFIHKKNTYFINFFIFV